jgi:hypothetical protein
MGPIESVSMEWPSKATEKLIPWNLPINYLFSQLAQFKIKVSKSQDCQWKVLHLVLVAISPALFWFLEVLSDEKLSF